MAQETETAFGWYHSRDQEYWYGPYATREEAIAEGTDEGPFYICEASKSYYDVELSEAGETMLENLEGLNEDKISPEQGLFPHLKNEQIADLTTMLNAAFSAWMIKHNLSRESWAFATVRNEEVIDPTEQQVS